MWVRHNGMFKIIVSNHDVKFTLEFWTLLMKKMGTKLKFNIVLHSQTNGQTKENAQDIESISP
jgi:hypothetical protein